MTKDLNLPADVKVEKISDTLYLITLFPQIPGFDDFIGVWLYKGKETFVVDVGPSVTIPSLVKALESLKIKHLDYILLTHIHIDHAGGLGDIVDFFPKARIICHEAGIPHLIDPERLWKGTVKVLEDIGRAYGRIKPVDSKHLVDAKTFCSSIVTPVITPGHSQHHVSFYTKEFLFAGEAGGVCLSLDNGGKYLRPATPPKFFFETYLNSIDKLSALNSLKICYSHLGVRDDAQRMLRMHKDQLFLWKRIIKGEMKNLDNKDFVDNCINILLREDKLLSGFFEMENSVRKRERDFLANSVKGFLGYFRSCAKNEHRTPNVEHRIMMSLR
jgi:glyoxylase-like metal-dependent hydrolase (beta-lactamase superfamily II)